MHYYKFNISNWYLNTAHLTLEEEAVYFRLVNHYYDSEQPIPLETQSVIRRLRLGSYSDIVGLVLKEFFVLQEDGWHHKTCDELLEEYRLTADKNRKNGKSGGRPLKNKDLDNNPQITQSVSKDNPLVTLTKNYKLETNNYSSEFESFWKAYDKPKGKTNAYKVWKSLKLDEEGVKLLTLKATQQALVVERQFRKDAERWLKGKHWEDDLGVVVTDKPKDFWESMRQQ